MLRKSVLSVILFLFISIFSFGQKKVNPHINFDEVIELEKTKGTRNLIQNSENESDFDATYYKLNLIVNPDTLYISGAITIHFIPTSNLTELFFDLSALLRVDSILHTNNPITFNHTDDKIRITEPFLGSILDSVTIYYHGHPAKESTSIVADYHNGTPIIWTLSEPYGAKDWWACKQSLLDKADSIDLFVTAPKINKVAGNGNLISETINGNFKTTHWKCSYPIVPYLVGFAVTPYAEISFNTSLQNGSLFVQNYVYKEDSTHAHSQLFTTDTLLRFYDSVIGPYPFMTEKYGHAQFGRGGGMEHQTMSFMYHFGFGLIAHELAHQWFGDKITCGSWQDIWLNEGFATFFAGLPLQTMYGESEWMNWKAHNLERTIQEPNGSVFVVDTANVGRIFEPNLSYAKGALVLHQLRYQIGDEFFFNGIKAYISDPKLVYKTALTDDFFRNMELVSGLDLSTYKNQWIYGKGFPSYNLEWEQKGAIAKFKLTQTTSDASVPFFNLVIPILLESETGDSAWLYINNTENNQEFEFNPNFTITTVSIDPELNIISKANFVINTASIKDFEIYPNPTSNALNIIPGGSFSRITGLKIIGYDGKTIIERSGINHTSKFEIDVSQLSQGSYQLVLYSKNESVIKGIVITR